MASPLTIDLVPHKGMQRDELQTVEIEHDQWMVYANVPEDTEPAKRLFVGYLPHAKGRPFLPYTSFSALSVITQKQITDAISLKAGDFRPVGIMPLPLDALKNIDPDGDDGEDADDGEEDEE